MRFLRHMTPMRRRRHSHRYTPAIAIGIAALLGMLLVASSVRADGAAAAQRLRDLYRAYYNERVLEYCGLMTAEVHDGYQRRVRSLLASADIDPETNRRIKISGWTDADWQYDDHGLGGYRHWCGTDGRQAAEEFLAFRDREISGRTR